MISLFMFHWVTVEQGRDGEEDGVPHQVWRQVPGGGLLTVVQV